MLYMEIMHGGKTNIIEAIFLCCMGKSFRAKSDGDLIQFQENACHVEVEFEKIDRTGKISCKIDKQKVFLLNGIKQNRISDIIGKINCIIFTPDDIGIIKEGPDQRRKFLDMMISRFKTKIYSIVK